MSANAVAVLRKLSRREYREKYPDSGAMERDAMMNLDEVFGCASAVRRASEHLPGVSEAQAATLDTMLDAHGLRAVLKSLRELCDSRSGHETEEMEFDDMESGEKWIGAAQALEHFLHMAQVNVK